VAVEAAERLADGADLSRDDEAAVGRPREVVGMVRQRDLIATPGRAIDAHEPAAGPVGNEEPSGRIDGDAVREPDARVRDVTPALVERPVDDVAQRRAERHPDEREPVAHPANGRRGCREPTVVHRRHVVRPEAVGQGMQPIQRRRGGASSCADGVTS
jgi:hypothetical protein